MSLQEDVNQEVALINAKLTSATAEAGQIVSTPVDLSAVIEAIPTEQTVDFGAVVIALSAAADQIDTLSGDSSAIRAAIGNISNQSIDLSTVKEAATEVGSLMSSVSENLDRAAKATGDHLESSSGMVSLLINQSNFDGAGEI